MSRTARKLALTSAAALLLLVGVGPAMAQYVVVPHPCPPAVVHYAPPAVSYYAGPAVSYYAAVPSVSYYAPPAVSYYAAPVVSYYAPPAVSYAAAPAVTTTTARYGLFGRRLVTTSYYSPAVSVFP
jgi:hypothetical protein